MCVWFFFLAFFSVLLVSEKSPGIYLEIIPGMITNADIHSDIVYTYFFRESWVQGLLCKLLKIKNKNISTGDVFRQLLLFRLVC